MYETFAMKVGEHVQDGRKHLTGFSDRERPAGKNLRKVLLGTFHYDIDDRHAAKLEASHFMDRNQVRVRQLRGLLPTRQLEVARCRSRRNNLDRGFYETFCRTALGKEYRAVFGPAQVSKQRKFVVEGLIFPLYPCVGHDSTLSQGSPGSGPIVCK